MVDYRGQKLCEQLYYIITILFGVLGFFAGYAQDEFLLSVKVWAVGMVLALVLCVPDWPFYNKNKVQWLKSIPTKGGDKIKESDAVAKDVPVTVKKSKKSKKTAD